MGRILLGLGIAALVGFGVGYRLMPTKVTIKTEIKEVEKRVVLRHTTTTITKKPDGTTTTVIVNNDQIKDDKSSSNNSLTIKERDKLNWQIGAAYLSDISGNKTIVGTLQRRIIGEVYVGVYGTSARSAGLGISMRF